MIFLCMCVHVYIHTTEQKTDDVLSGPSELPELSLLTIKLSWASEWLICLMDVLLILGILAQGFDN